MKMALVYPLVVYCDYLQHNVKYGDRIDYEAKQKKKEEEKEEAEP